ncbi:MAG: glycyl-radical enzyme activating protein [Prevotella sp.]|nr:glycyl-radical enzyme activating protein [Prevotella sp.]
MDYIFDIKRYAINDGPGIRTTLFMKGCPLRCVWCHNPEGWSPQPQLLYKRSKCIGCQTCVAVCPEQALRLTPDGIVSDAGRCTVCGRCADECPTRALEVCGRRYTLDELMAEVEKERAVMTDSGGGVTLCGGEPLMHPQSALEILRELGRRGLHRTVDTTLYAQADVVETVAGECELLLVDLKLMDAEQHRRYTGVSNDLILSNIRLVARLGVPFWIRIPLIEGVNADEENIEATARFLQSLHSPPSQGGVGGGSLHLLPYHDVGKDKHLRMGSQYNPQAIPMATPTEATLQRCRQQFEAFGLRTVVGG